MKDSHRIIVESRKVKYDFTVKRNITILTGDSGSGKTVLIDLIRDYRRLQNWYRNRIIILLSLPGKNSLCFLIV